MQEQVIVAAHHRGPPGSGNGGYVCGLLAARINGPAEVTLRLPTPLQRPLTLLGAATRVELRDGDDLIAEARPAPLDLAVPEAPDWAACEAATVDGGSFDTSDFAGCFSCGRHNPLGVQVWAGPIPGRAMTAAAWVPTAAHAGPDGFLPATHLWAALDCPGAMALALNEPDIPLMTGRMLGQCDADCRPGERYRVIGWPVGRDGRKLYCGTAVIDERGRVRARALATWIELRRAAMPAGDGSPAKALAF
jgi:hypothetical protein